MARAWILAVALAAAACGSPESPRASRESHAPQALQAPKAPQAPRIVILGDSLTAGLGLPVDQAYPSLLQQRLKSEGLDYEVVNAGVSGDTSAGGLSRLDWALQGDVRILVVALGGNDGLRGLPPEALKRNLSEIIERAQARHVQVILAGMEATTPSRFTGCTRRLPSNTESRSCRSSCGTSPGLTN